MPEPEMSDDAGAGQDTRALEALLFVSDEPITASVLAQALDMNRTTVEGLCERLARELEDRGSGLVLRNVAGGWRLFTHPDTETAVEQFVLSSRQARLTKAALETMSIVAYKQPVTRHQISAIRGVNSDGVLRALTDRGLIEEAGREETPGRPVLYGTTPGFLERLGLPSLASLPSLARCWGWTPRRSRPSRPPPSTTWRSTLRRRPTPNPSRPTTLPPDPCRSSAFSARLPGPVSAHVEPASS
jgi:segregation and condensation protein B